MKKATETAKTNELYLQIEKRMKPKIGFILFI
jgi:hypothetical protein